MSWARELPRHAAIRIQVHMPAAEASGEHARVLGQAVSHYFGYRAIVTSCPAPFELVLPEVWF